MESLLCWSLVTFVIAGLCPLVISAQSPLQCSDSNLNITGGTFTISTKNKDQILRYQCPPGYYPHPVKMRLCSGGRWNPEPTTRHPECKRVTCPNPNVLVNGVVEPHQLLYYYNDTTTYRCHPGYNFRGSSTRVCRLNGKWSGFTPICSRSSDHCPDPGTPPGASRAGHTFRIQDKVIYSCDNKLKLLGSKMRMCQLDGQWSGREPECYADFTYDTPEEVAEDFGSTLKATLTMHEKRDDFGKKIRLDQKENLNIYIVLDASDSIDESDFEKAKSVIVKLLEKISYYEVSPNYEIIIFTTDVFRIVSITESKGREKNHFQMIKKLQDFTYSDRGHKTGTNIAKALETVLDAMRYEKIYNTTGFNDIHHVIIMLTDGLANMGGDPIHKINDIKQFLNTDDDKKGDEKLDLYVFGVGDDVETEDINKWVTKRVNEKHFFLLPDIENLQQTFDEMIDESTSVGLCGLYRDYDEDDQKSRHWRFPWLIKFSVTRDGHVSSCLGSLVSPSFILTAAHCFKSDDIPEKILIDRPIHNSDLEVKAFMVHPKYKPTERGSEGRSESKYDVALIELKNPVRFDTSLRPICIPCTKETSGALKLSGSEVTCQTHKDKLLNNNLVKAHFMSAKRRRNLYVKNNVLIKLGQERDACIEDASRTLGISKEQAQILITDNFLCTGGETQNYIDDNTCKGDGGGGTFVEQKFRAIQVGVVSWGLNDVCTDKLSRLVTSRDFHVDLFNPEVQNFLQKYLADENRGAPLQFLN